MTNWELLVITMKYGTFCQKVKTLKFKAARPKISRLCQETDGTRWEYWHAIKTLKRDSCAQLICHSIQVATES